MALQHNLLLPLTFSHLLSKSMAKAMLTEVGLQASSSESTGRHDWQSAHVQNPAKRVISIIATRFLLTTHLLILRLQVILVQHSVNAGKLRQLGITSYGKNFVAYLRESFIL